MRPTIKILLADDHKMFIAGIKAVLETNPNYQVVAECVNGSQALLFAESNVVDLALIDVSMPELDGAEATKALKSLQPNIKIIAVTMHQELGVIRKMLRSGADSYLLKETSADELFLAIDKVLLGENYISPLISGAVMQALKIPASKSFATLTPREKEVLLLISDGLTTQDIADKLFLSINTIETHRKNMLAKLSLKNTAQLVRYAIEKGIL